MWQPYMRPFMATIDGLQGVCYIIPCSFKGHSMRRIDLDNILEDTVRYCNRKYTFNIKLRMSCVPMVLSFEDTAYTKIIYFSQLQKPPRETNPKKVHLFPFDYL